MTFNLKTLLALCSTLALAPAAAFADTITVAVAANFSAPMQKIASGFEAATGHKLELSVGSTGRFYAQIRNGAPFDVLLAADTSTPEKLVNDGLALAQSRHTYAIGTLVLYSQNAGLVDNQGEVLKNGGFSKIALADPKLAPYGKAALETLEALGLATTLQPKFVFGESIGQTWQFVATENAALGFVAGSQVASLGNTTIGSRWVVPQHLYTPLRQDVVILNRAKDSQAAHALINWLRGADALGIIESYGYSIDTTKRP
ncbi:MAG: molybdate ABC transporter substrate-binding protein [Pusillimonas sp.]